jgi:hypothetical protein
MRLTIDELRAEVEQLQSSLTNEAKAHLVACQMRNEAEAENKRLKERQDRTALAWTKLTASQEQEIERLRARIDQLEASRRWGNG